MMQPTVAGKVYTASSYGLQMMLAAGGLVVFGGIAYSLYGNLAKRTSPTVMFGMAMDKLNQNPQTEIQLGMPIRGFGEDGRHGRHMEHKQYRKAEDPTVYTYLKFHVQGKKHDGVCHVEYAD